MLLGLMKQSDYMHIGKMMEEDQCDTCAWLMEHG